MTDATRAFNRLHKRLQTVAKYPPLPKMTSVVFAQLFLAWRIHRSAALRTVVSGVIELKNWHEDNQKKKPPADPQLAALDIKIDVTFLSSAVRLMDTTIDTLGAVRLDQYIELITSIADSAVTIFGGDVLKRCLEFAEACKNVAGVSGLPTRKLRTAHDEILQLETSMQMMLANAMLVEASVGSMTGRFKNLEMTQPQRLHAWKEPVIARITEFKAAADEIFTNTILVNLPDEGYWPPHLL